MGSFKDRAVIAAKVNAARTGDRRAQEFLYNYLKEVLPGLLKKDLGSEIEASDVVTSTWIAAMRSLDQLRDPGKFLPFSLGIAKHIISRERRRRRHQRCVATFDDLAEELIAYRDPAERNPEAAEWMEGIRGRVKEADLELFLKRHWDGASLNQLQAETGLSKACLKKRFERMRRKLRSTPPPLKP